MVPFWLPLEVSFGYVWQKVPTLGLKKHIGNKLGKLVKQSVLGRYTVLGVDPLKENKQPAARALGIPGCCKGC